jgi:hypothetical protein
MAREIDAVAPAAERKQSAFLRRALRKALDEAAEERMAAAYRKLPDREPASLHPETWHPRAARRRTRRK